MMISHNVAHSVENVRGEIERAKTSFGVTDLFKFRDPKINEYLHGGFGSSTDFELITVAGKTNIGKSLFTQNMLLAAIRAKKRFAYICLEDSMKNTIARLEKMIDPGIFQQADKLIFTEEDVREIYTIEDALDFIEYLYEIENVELVVLDHLQFLQESIDRNGLKVDENNLSRILMRKMNRMMKLNQKTLILVSHVNKRSEKDSELLDMIIGSSAIVQASTKVLYLSKDENNDLNLQLIKSRYTKRQDEPLVFEYDDNTLEVRAKVYYKTEGVTNELC